MDGVSRSSKGPRTPCGSCIEEVHHDSSHDLGIDPGLQKDGVEKHLQELLAEHPATLAAGLTLVRREFPTAIGPVDLLCRDADGASVAVEIKRRGEIDGVEQLTRYLELLNRDPLLRRCAASSPPRRSSGRPGCSPPTAASRAQSSTTTPCAASTTRPDAALLMAPVFHVATVGEWVAAQESGSYTTSTRGRTLAEEGFIHASREEQWPRVHQRFYADVTEPLLLLVIDTELLDVPLVEEEVPGRRDVPAHLRAVTAVGGRGGAAARGSSRL